MGWGWGWRPYVSVAERRAGALRQLAKLERKGLKVEPIRIEGRRIAGTFWGQAWCEHLESFSDFENRLPRGRTYVRNGSVVHLEVQKGRVVAKVSGSELYDVGIAIATLPPTRWQRLRSLCTGQVGSALELLEGRLSDRVMSIVTDRDMGLFPGPKEIKMRCSCPDWATMCKHVAAVLYGVGSRLDHQPELLFLLRGVDYQELLTEASVTSVVARAPRKTGRVLKEEGLGEVFGIDLAAPDGTRPPETPGTGGKSPHAIRAAKGPRKGSARVTRGRRGSAPSRPQKRSHT